MRTPIRMCVLSLIAVAGLMIPRSNAEVQYVPHAQLCARPSHGLCSQVPAYIGPDPALGGGVGYSGLFGPLPSSPVTDVQTPFDNMALADVHRPQLGGRRHQATARARVDGPGPVRVADLSQGQYARRQVAADR
jgi:hypothetical protein